jgi:hypothetical protein
VGSCQGDLMDYPDWGSQEDKKYIDFFASLLQITRAIYDYD